MRLPDMAAIGIAIGTRLIPILIIIAFLFLLAVPGGASIHGITIRTTAMAIIRMTTHMIIPTTIADIPTTGMATHILTPIATTMAMRLQASTATQLSVQYS